MKVGTDAKCGEVWCVLAGVEGYVSGEPSGRVQGEWEGKPQ